ncbi:MAG: putative membrane protein [Dokdonia sp.]|jgi:uncharacterized membrane protein
MEQKLNTIDLDYVDARKVTSIYIKLFAFLLVFIIALVPMYEFIPKLQHPISHYGYGYGCLIIGHY